VRIVEEAVRDIRNNVRRVLEPRYSSDSASDSELIRILLSSVFSFLDLDHSLLVDNRIEQQESLLISYKNNLFVNTRTDSIERYGDASTVNARMMRSRTIRR